MNVQKMELCNGHLVFSSVHDMLICL